MAEMLIQSESLTAIADKIRVLKGTTESMSLDKMEAELDIPKNDSGDLTASGATVTVPSGYYASQATKSVATATRANTTISTTADDANDKLTITASNNQSTGYVTGSNKTASTTISLTASGATVTASDGTNSISKSVATATQATPSVSVDSAGKITATATQSAGYVSAGTKTGTKQLTTQAAKTITPTTSSQTAVASGVYTTGTVTVGAIPSTYVKPTATKSATTYTPTTSNQTITAGTYCSGTQTIKGDANLVAENIKSGVSIFGVAGSLEEGGTYTLVNNSNTAYIEYCGNWLAPNSSVVSSIPAYSNFTYSGFPCKFSPRLSIIVPSGSTLLSNISAKVGDVTTYIPSSSFYNMGTSAIGTHYVLATTNKVHSNLFLNNGEILTIVAN